MSFSGKLSDEQESFLREQGVSERKISVLNHYLNIYKNGLTDYVDLVGDDLLPGKLLFYNLKHFGHLLELNPDMAISKHGINIRKKITIPLVKKVGPLFLKSSQIFEDRNELKAYAKKKGEYEDKKKFDVIPHVNELEFEKDKGIVLPDRPVIWTLNHGFKDDVLASVLAVQRNFYMFFGSMPQFYNTFDGILAYLIGTIIVNRKSKESRKAGQEKLLKIMAMGVDILYAPEGVWNKSSNKLLVHLWPGIYRMAKETGAKLVPIVHYINDSSQRMPKKANPIHTVVDDPIDITYMPEKEALEYYRDVLATWFYIMMEKYGVTNRKEIVDGYGTTTEAFEDEMKNRMNTVDRYDTEFEKRATYQPSEVIEPEDAFNSIAGIEAKPYNVLQKLYAQDLVKIRTRENFQKRY